MKSTSESSFRAKMGRAHDLLTYISVFENYAPTRPEERMEGMTFLVNELLAVNASVAGLKDSYKSAVDDRKDAFSKKEDSLQKLIIQIKAAVESQYGKDSSEAISINRTIAMIRNAKVKKQEPDLSTETDVKSISRSERSYGAMAQVLNDIISALSNYPDYETSNERVKVETLRETALKLNNLNVQVAKKIRDMKMAILGRRALYDELRSRVQRVKAYVKGQYGISSTEYVLIKGMRF